VKQEVFNSEYYVAVATVIPVFLLAAVVSRAWGERQEDHDKDPVERNVTLLAVVLLAFTGEMAALGALDSREEPSKMEDTVISFGYLIPAMFVCVNAAYRPARAAALRLPPTVRRILRFLYEPALLGALALFIFFDVNPSVLLAGFAFVVLLLPPFISMGRDVIGWRKGGSG
jgi:hypothetical protein